MGRSVIQKVRLAQFATVPEPITRLVLEVADGTHATVSRCSGGVQLVLQAVVAPLPRRYCSSTELPISSHATRRGFSRGRNRGNSQIVSKTSYELAPDRAAHPQRLGIAQPCDGGWQSDLHIPTVGARRQNRGFHSKYFGFQPACAQLGGFPP